MKAAETLLMKRERTKIGTKYCETRGIKAVKVFSAGLLWWRNEPRHQQRMSFTSAGTKERERTLRKNSRCVTQECPPTKKYLCPWNMSCWVSLGRGTIAHTDYPIVRPPARRQQTRLHQSMPAGVNALAYIRMSLEVETSYSVSTCISWPRDTSGTSRSANRSIFRTFLNQAVWDPLVCLQS